MELLIQNVTHPDTLECVDVWIKDEKIAAVEKTGSFSVPKGTEAIDGTGYVLLPTLVDAHAHLDKTVYGMDWFVNKLDYHIKSRIENERTARRELGLDPYRQACRYIERSLSLGVLHMRSHVDVDEFNGLDGLFGVLEAREKYKDLMDLEITAFPQSGILIRPGVAELLDKALEAGADLVGGLDPAAIDRDPKGSVDTIFSIAEKHGKPVDIHLHEPGELGAFSMELIAERTKAAGMEGRVTVSHAFCLGSPDEKLRGRLYEKLADAGISIVTAAQPGAGSVPIVRELLDAGVRVCGGNDNMRDLWSPFGSGDMVERAQFIAMKNNFRRDEDLRLAFDLCTEAGAELMGLKGYGIRPGCQADILLARARNIPECVVTCPADRIVIRKGRRV